MVKKTMFRMLIFALLCTGCNASATYELKTKYTPVIREISYKYGLEDARVSVEILQDGDYQVEIFSQVASNLSQEQSTLFSRELHEAVSASEFEIAGITLSDGNSRVTFHFDSLRSTP